MPTFKTENEAKTPAAITVEEMQTILEALRTLREERAPDNLADQNGNENEVTENQPTHTPKDNSIRLTFREQLAQEFLCRMLPALPSFSQSYNTKTYINLAFGYADSFIERANQDRAECDMEEL